MKRGLTVFSIAILLIGLKALVANATLHKNPALGYQVNLPVNWKVLDLQKIKTEPELLKSSIADATEGDWKTADKNLTKTVGEMVGAGKVDYFVNRDYPDSIICVSETQGKLPKDDQEVLTVCESLPAELSKQAGKPIQVYNCQAGSVDNSNALFLASDAYEEGNKSFQYEIQKSPNEVLVFTATCPDQNCEAVHKTMWDIIRSIQFQ